MSSIFQTFFHFLILTHNIPSNYKSSDFNNDDCFNHLKGNLLIVLQDMNIIDAIRGSDKTGIRYFLILYLRMRIKISDFFLSISVDRPNNLRDLLDVIVVF
mgnify:CR=1 FL=1